MTLPLGSVLAASLDSIEDREWIHRLREHPDEPVAERYRCLTSQSQCQPPRTPFIARQKLTEVLKYMGLSSDNIYAGDFGQSACIRHCNQVKTRFIRQSILI